MQPKDIEAGLAIRRKVMGEQHVNKRQSSNDKYTLQQQELVNGFSWGQIWTRPQLALKERSLVTLAFICAADRMDELPGHIRGALNNGATPDEIVEVFVHGAVYCGFPSSNTAVRRCVEVFKEIGVLT